MKPITVQLSPIKAKDGRKTFRLRLYDTITHKYRNAERLEGIVSYRKDDEGEQRAKDLKDKKQTEINTLLYSLGECDYFKGYQKYIAELSNAVKSDENDFVKYFEYIMNRKENIGTRGCYELGFSWFKRFIFNKFQTTTLPFGVLAKQMHSFCEDYKAFLFKNVGHDTEYKRRFNITNQNSCRNFFAHYLHVMREAQKELKLPFYLAKRIPKYKNPKNALTGKELELLWKTPMENQQVKEAFLLSALAVGSRISDTRRLRWSNLSNEADGLFIQFTMKKTQKIVKSQLNEKIIDKILSRKGKGDELVFTQLPNDDQAINASLKVWAKKAGVYSRICTHVARVTTGTRLLKKTGSLKIVAAALGTTVDVANESYAHLDIDQLNYATSADIGIKL